MPARLPLDEFGFGRHFGVDDEGRHLIAIMSDRPRVLDFDLKHPTRVRELGTACKAGHIALSPTGRWAASGGWQGTGTTIWNLPDGSRFRELQTADAFVFFSPDGRWLLTGGHDAYTFWDTGSWQVVREIARTGSNQRGPAAFTRDGSVVAIAKSADEVQLIDVADGSEIATLRPPHRDVIAWMNFSPDARRLAVSCEGGDIQVWRLDRIDAQLAAQGLTWRPLVRSKLAPGPAAARARLARAVQAEFSPTAYPAGFMLEPTAEVAWQPVDALQARDWHQTLAGLNRAIEKEPNRWQLRRDRGVNLARFSQWEQADADLSAALALGADNLIVWYYLALTRYARRDVDGYRAAARQLLDRFGNTDNASDANLIAWICALPPDSLEDYQRPLALSQFAVGQHRNHLHQNTFGAVCFRSGQMEEAIRALERAIELHSVDGTPLDWLFLAMANGKSGRIEEAQRWMERTCTWLAQPGRELTWIERVEYHGLLRESRQIVESSHAP